MIEYDEEWLASLFLQWRGSVIPSAAWGAIPSCLVTLALLFWEDFDPGARQELGFFDINGSQIWNATTAALVIVLSFRTQRGLARFWEGTGLLHQMRGEWFDTVSNCVSFSISAKKTKPEQVMKFRHTLVRLMSRCHGSALEEIAGNSIEVQAIDTQGLDPGTLNHMNECETKHKFNKVEVMLHLVQSLITRAHDDKVLLIPPPILSRVYQTISRGFVNLLNAKKIVDTRFPFPYVHLSAFLLLSHIIMTPLIITSIVRSKILAVIYTFVPTTGMFALNRIAIELENPFGTDENDLPMEHFQTEMNQCLLMLLHNATDMISWTSPFCIMEFEALLEHQRKSHKAGKVRRLSDFGTVVYTEYDPLEDELRTSHDEKPSQHEKASTGTTWSAESRDMKTTVGDTSPREDSAAKIPPEVAKGVEDFEKAFVDWMKAVETQMGQLKQSFEGLKTVNEQATALIAASDTGNLSTGGTGGWEKAISPV
jgi:predicted membrane chloride channel (bestrophin family)